MPRDEVIDAQACGPGAAVLVVPLEIDHVLAGHDLARLGDQKAVHLERACRPGVEDQTLTFYAVLVGQPAAALDPGLGLFLRCQRPAQKSLNLVLAVDNEGVVLAIDLADEDARPVAEAQIGEGRLGHQVVHGEPERHVRALGPEQSQVRTRRGRPYGRAVDGRLQHGFCSHPAALGQSTSNQFASGVWRPEMWISASGMKMMSVFSSMKVSTPLLE